VSTGINEDYGYDPVGNRLTKAGQIAPSVFDAANRLLQDAEYTYAYDDNGNLTSKTHATTSQVTSYSYDAENQLISVQSPVASAQYKYDGLGRRIEKAINSSPFTRYIYDNEDILLEFDAPPAGSTTLTARYTHGVGIDEPLMMERDLNANATFEPTERFFYHSDGLGSITDLTNNTGAIAQSYLYDSFGQIITVTSGLENPYTYTGRELDNESGLYFYRARYYDPTVGRFLQEDPIKGFLFLPKSQNNYAYTLNNPINFIDPLGESAIDCIALVITIYSAYQLYKAVDPSKRGPEIQQCLEKGSCEDILNGPKELLCTQMGEACKFLNLENESKKEGSEDE
jgi:RHS repeat-associated protein